ncbi:flagellar hook-basal body complex protein FliE [Paenibacillus pasadenensis]|uniref:flagellar hook-basal body complex protein FliE n=1 Tax=Paenibacillus pasadenensis TaxID=217090 RepID=UPI00203D7695|nr:flagellar hook-basal body complex protein FliE [Paenibacillus pasadenensis]MCM3746014.1 flagellar hook-basal body complex protein FliE [Paenibacillus pasadenensis]
MIQPLSLTQVGQSLPLTNAPKPMQATPSELTESFSSMLKSALDSVSAQEQNVHKVNNQFLIGNADISEVMIAAQQAQLNLQLVTQVRNKAVEAYQEIMRMQF